MIRISQADDEDDAILDLQRATLPDDDPLPVDKATWWLAYDGDTPVAYAALSDSSQSPGTRAYLSRAGVLASHRGMGLQKRLIRVRVKAARRLGFTEVVTDTVSENAASINSLVACGFRAYVPQEPWGLTRSVYWRRGIPTYQDDTGSTQ